MIAAEQLKVSSIKRPLLDPLISLTLDLSSANCALSHGGCAHEEAAGEESLSTAQLRLLASLVVLLS